MQIELSEQCANELCDKFRHKILFDIFEEDFHNHYLDAEIISVPKDTYQRFLDDVYEKFQEYNDYATSWDDALQQAMDGLLYNGDYYLYDCEKCHDKQIVLGDDKGRYKTEDGKILCQHCFEKMYVACHKCGRSINNESNAVHVHGHSYCNECAQELLTHLMQPDVTENK